jgi:hypothetical protein
MIETRYKVVNKWLREIRDIDVQESSVKGSSGSFGVTTPLHCKVGEYLDTNLKFHDNTFQKSLNSGLLKTYLQRGDIIQVYYDTVEQKEVDSPYGNMQPNTQVNSQVTAMAQMFNDAGITANDLKDLIGLLKAKKVADQNVNTNPNTNINTVNQQIQAIQRPIVVEMNTLPKRHETNNIVEQTVQTEQQNVQTKGVHTKPQKQAKKQVKAKVSSSTTKTKRAKKQTNTSLQSKDNGAETTKIDTAQSNGMRYDKDQVDPKTKALQVMFNNFNYQQRLNYIKEQCESMEMLKWIQANFHQTAIFNAVTNKIQTLEKADIESI